MMQPDAKVVPAQLVPTEVLEERPDESTIRHRVRDAIGSADYEHWFAQRTRFAVEADELVVAVGNPFLLNWMQGYFRESLSAVARTLLGSCGRVRMEVDPTLSAASAEPVSATDAEPGPEPRAAEPEPATSAPARPRPERPASPQDGGRRPWRRRRDRDLADFVEGDCNRLALTAVRRACEEPGRWCNPLLLVGNIGTGKTHLVEGATRRIRREHRTLNVTCLTAEVFGNYFVEALRDHSLPAFRQRFRSTDVLLIDDADFFAGKRVIQEEFLNTFKHLESQGKQVVVSMSRHPRLVAGLSDELSSRLVSGIVCRIENPDPATRRSIVARRSEKLKLAAEPDALEHVARRFSRNVRELEGAVNCLRTWHEMTGRRVRLQDAREVLSELERDCVRVVRVSDVEKAVCQFFGVDPNELKSPRRHRAVSRPRMLAMFLARRLTGAAYSEIGRYFGNRNHTTVLAAERKVKSWVEGREPIAVSAESWTMDDVIDALQRELAG